MTTGDVPFRKRRIIYVISAVILGLIAIFGIVVFTQTSQDLDATVKAEQLHGLLLDAGLPAPEVNVLADSLGRDGGFVCQDPSSPLIKARYQSSISNGATGPGSRPVIGDRDTVTAVELTIATYCPDRLGDYLERVQDMKFEDTTKTK